MATAILQVCDPELYPLNDAVEKALVYAQGSPCFELKLVKYLQTLCLSPSVPLATVFRGMEMLRPFVRSSDPRIASKSVLVLGRQSRSVAWIKSALREADDRVRANLIESMWYRTEPDIELLFQYAVGDRNHRAAANAVYGLYLSGSELYAAGLDQLAGHSSPLFRRSAVWVIKSCSKREPADESRSRLKILITDADARVRRAAFAALEYLRRKALAKTAPAAARELS